MDGTEDDFWILTTGVPKKNLRNAISPIDKFDSRQIIIVIIIIVFRIMPEM
jgi:hypothetical protein